MKQIKKILKLIIEGGKATPAPPLGPSLAQYGINIGEFCNQFNQATKDIQGVQIPVEVTIYEDRTFSFVLKKPPISYLIKKELGIEKGAKETGREIIGTLTKEQVRKIAEEKLPDLNTRDVEKAMKIVEGVAKSMGVKIAS
ncbi:MAG: 50S ribosomal protein L11 [Candidatus Parcubacteria bacterium]|nr:MAG: 50S ribosomal protein L11 [Candidatus Parcubacteria bacterium]